ncbi:MAG: hypothetical protein ACYCV8_06765, partial [bacterium]
MKLNINIFKKVVENKIETLKSLRKLEKIALAAAFATTVVFFVRYISSQKFHNFLVSSYSSLTKYHNRTILFR